MRPLAIAVVMAGVVLLAFGTWLILRASFGFPRKERPARRPPRPAPQVADRPRPPVPFPPAAAARTSAPLEDADWQPPVARSGWADEDAGAVHEPGLFDDWVDEPAAEPGPAESSADEQAESRPTADEETGEPGRPDEQAEPRPAADEETAAPDPAESRPADEETAEAGRPDEPAPVDLPAGSAAWGTPVFPADELAKDVTVVPAREETADDAGAEQAPAAEGVSAEQPDGSPAAGAAAGAAVRETPDEAQAAGTAEAPGRQPEDAASAGPAVAGAAAPAAAAGAAAAAAAAWAARHKADDVPQAAPRSSFAESLAAQADEPDEKPGPTPPVPLGDAVMPMGTVLGGSPSYPPLQQPRTPLPPPAPPAEKPGDPLQDWAEERPTPAGHELGPIVDQQGPLPDLGATPPGGEGDGEPDDDWAARFGALAEQLGEPGAAAPPAEPPDQPWPSRQGPPQDEQLPMDFPAGPRRPDPDAWAPPEPGARQPFGPPRGQEAAGRRDEPFDRPYGQEAGRRDDPFGGPYGQPPGPPPPPYRPAGAEPAGFREQGPQTPRAAPRSRQGRPEDPRQAAVYDALAINERVLDEVWTSPSVDVLKVVSSIVVNALDAYEDDPAEYADWVAVHRTGNCDCH